MPGRSGVELAFVASPDPKRYERWRYRRRVLRAWNDLAGRVSADAESRRGLDVPPEQWSTDVLADRQELVAAMRRITGHVALCRGDGRRCACRLLNLGLSAFRARALDTRRREAARWQRVVLYAAVSVLFVVLFQSVLREAARHFRTGTEGGAFVGAAVAGVAAGLIVAALQKAVDAISLVAGYGGERLTRVGNHPDGGWIFLADLVPVWRGKVRRRRLQRELEAWEELVRSCTVTQDRLSGRVDDGQTSTRVACRATAVVGAAAGAAVVISLLRRHRTDSHKRAGHAEDRTDHR